MSPCSTLLLTLLSSAVFAGNLSAQTLTPPVAPAVVQSSGPAEFQINRAEKIADKLHLADTAKTTRVRDIIARQYYDLGLIQATRDASIAAAKHSEAADKQAARSAIKAAQASAETAELTLHPQFLARLATELIPAQIDQVKEGMTYGVLTVTFRVYQEMLPNLTADQKAQILAWLTEARERAMDAGSSKEKHAWFGKFKGRINIYLTKQGYNLKDAEKRLFSKH